MRSTANHICGVPEIYGPLLMGLVGSSDSCCPIQTISKDYYVLCELEMISRVTLYQISLTTVSK